MTRQIQFIAVIIFLLCVNLFAQKEISSSKFNTTESFKNGQVIYKNAPNGINAGPYLDLEGFEDPFFPPVNWELFTYDFDWELTMGFSNSGNNSAVMYCEPYNEAWLITPKIDLSTGVDPFLRYYEYVELDQGLEAEHFVYISTDYDGLGDPTNYSWDILRSGIQNVFSWNLREIDLSSYIGDSVYIAFYYFGNQDDNDCGTTWYLDDVEVDELCSGVDPVPDCATINSPPDGATSLHRFASFYWGHTYEDVTKQFFYVGTDGGGITTPTNLFNGLEFSANTIGVGPVELLPNTTYYWQIIPANCSQTAVNCPIWSFTTNDGQDNFGGGGTTQGGYYFANSTAGASGSPSQPIYNWIDISGTGTDSIGTIADDMTIGPLPLGFSFNYFGTDYTQFNINANGFISFGTTTGQTNFPYPIPLLNAPNNLIAGFWKDLDPTNSNVSNKHLYYGLSGGEMAVSFVNYPQKGGDADGWITFQIIIKPSGNIKIQYQNAGNTFDINNGTVGVENNDGTEGILYRHRQYGGAISGFPLAVEFGLSDSALPVELSSFSGAIIGKSVKLKWVTETEVSNYGFEVERKSDIKGQTSNNWVNIGFVNGNGNSNSPKHYSFTDDDVIGGKHSYRLKQIDNDGEFAYSNVLEVNINLPLEYSLRQNYPNPFNPSTTIRYTIPNVISTEGRNINVQLKVYDVLGNEVATLVNEEKPTGVYEVEFNATELTSGVYFYKLQAGSFVEVKKMILLR